MLVPSQTYYNLILEVVHIDKTALRTPTKPNYTKKKKKKKHFCKKNIWKCWVINKKRAIRCFDKKIINKTPCLFYKLKFFINL